MGWRGGRGGGKRGDIRTPVLPTIKYYHEHQKRHTLSMKALCTLYRTLHIALVFANFQINIFRRFTKM